MRSSVIGITRTFALAAAVLLVFGAACGYAAEDVGHQDIAHAAGEAEGPNPLAVDPDLAIWTLIVFVLMFLVLKKFAWPQIVAALEERERRIAENIAAAEARYEDAKRLVAEHEARLAAAAGEVRELLEEARRDAEHTKRSIEAKGHQAAQDELARALREIERAKDAAVQELAVKSANVAVDLAHKVVRDQLTTERQNEIVREALGKLTTASPSTN
jgi:F-type H+-transporting ATPase subunit b